MAQIDLDNIAYNKFTDGKITLTEYIKCQNRDKIMNYVEKYKEALERARELLSSCIDDRDKRTKIYRAEDIESIFPELKESKYERIRKEILSFIKTNNAWNKEWITWLEKQSEVPVTIDIDKMVRDYANNKERDNERFGKPTNCMIRAYRQGLTDAIALSTLNVEYEPNPYSGVSFKYNGHTWGMCARDNGVEILVDGEIKERVFIKEEDIDNNTNKVEPKFRESDWIVHRGTENIYQVVAVIDNQYQLKYGDVYTLQNCADVDRCARLYDVVKDARDGDVLHSTGFHSDCIFIFNGLDNWKFDEPDGERAVATGYCCLTLSADNMEFVIQGPDCIEVNTVKPATKIQRDLLFQKMKEAGYEWDAEKKELKKTEDEIEIPFSAKDSELQEATYFIPKGFHAEIDDDKVVIKKGEKLAEWSENGNIRLQRIIDFLWRNRKGDTDAIYQQEQDIDWLKSLKRKIGQGLDPDKVIEWLRYHIQVDEPKIEYNEDGQPLAESFIAHAEARCMAADKVIERFKKDFKL